MRPGSLGADRRVRSHGIKGQAVFGAEGDGHALAMAQAVMRARLKLDHELLVAGDLEHGQRVVAEVDGVLHRGRQAVRPLAGRPVR